MSLEESEIRATVEAKLADRNADMALRRLRHQSWQPLLPALLSALLGSAMLVLAVRVPASANQSAILGAVLFFGIAYSCFLSYRQNVVARALAHKLRKLEERLDELGKTPDHRGEQEGGDSAAGDT